MYVTCALCGLVVPMPNVDTGSLPTCKCTFQVTYTNSTTAFTFVDWTKQLQIIRNWSATFHGRIDGQKQPVPDAFQDAFKDGELEP